MNTIKVIDTQTSYSYVVRFWVVGSETPGAPITVNGLDVQLAVGLRPDNAECFGFEQATVEERVIQLEPRGPHSRDFVIGTRTPIPGKHYIDGTVYDAKGLRKFSNSKELILRMHFAGTDRMVRTRYGNFQPFYAADSTVSI